MLIYIWFKCYNKGRLYFCEYCYSDTLRVWRSKVASLVSNAPFWYADIFILSQRRSCANQTLQESFCLLNTYTHSQKNG